MLVNIIVAPPTLLESQSGAGGERSSSVDAVEGEQMSVGVKFCSLLHSNPTLDMTLVTTTSTWTMIMVTLNTMSFSVSARLSSPERSSLPWSMVAAMVLTPVLIIKSVNRERDFY